MSSKKGDRVLLFPGGRGWEVWAAGVGEDWRVEQSTELTQVASVDGLPAGGLLMSLPVRHLAALPFKTPTTDESLFPDLAVMQIERSSMRPAADGGELSDCFVVATQADHAILLPVVLAAPSEGDLPSKSPQAFDLAARCLPLAENAVSLWQELGRWVFAVTRGRELLFFQTLSSLELDQEAGLELKLALAQLRLQGLLEGAPSRLVCWLEAGEDEAWSQEFESGVGLPITREVKPRPSWPSRVSRLLPANVHAERLITKTREQLRTAVGLVALLYLALLGFLGIRLHQKEKEAALLQSELASLGGETGFLLTHREKWDELAPVVESDFYPYELLHRVVKDVLPVGQVRLSQATFINQLKEIEGGGAAMPLREITLTGESDNTQDIARYSLNLNRSDLLADFQWVTPEPTKTNQDRWRFSYSAVVPD